MCLGKSSIDPLDLLPDSFVNCVLSRKIDVVSKRNATLFCPLGNDIEADTDHCGQKRLLVTKHHHLGDKRREFKFIFDKLWREASTASGDSDIADTVNHHQMTVLLLEVTGVTGAHPALGIDTFKTRDPERFRFDEDGSLVLVGLTGERRERMPREKFVLNTWGSDETPYGQGLLQQLYPLWYFKNNAIKELVRFVEKFGAPYLWANYPRGLSTAEQDALMEVLKLMQSNSVGIGPEGTEIRITEVGRQGVVEVFRFIIEEYVDRQYAKAILGQTLSTESQSGTYALAKFQSKNQQNIIEDDSLWQQEQLDGVIRTLIELNFGPLPAKRYPRFRIAYEEEKDLQSYLKAVSLAVNELGLELGQSWLREQIGFPAPRSDEPMLEGKRQPAPGAAEPWSRDLDE